MRIVWHSGAPWVRTGYGTQTAQVISRLKAAGHDVAVSTTWGLTGAALEWNGIPVFPSDERWGNITLPDIAARQNADLVVTLLDVWVMNADRLKNLNVACWTPIDHLPCPPKVAGFFKRGNARPLAMSEFGLEQLKDEGLDPLYVPHAIDTEVYKPPTMDRRELRKTLGIPEDAFVVGMVANNAGHTPPRKAFGEAIMAFAHFRKDHPEAFLYLHSEASGQRFPGNPGLNLPYWCNIAQIPPTSIGFAPQVDLDFDIPNESMADLYGAMDVLLNPAYGEGFGIPIIEAQACGTPVIVGDWTSMPELCGAGWTVAGQPWADHDHGAFFFCPWIPSIMECLEKAYDDAAGLREQAREFALAYDADRVFDTHWKPVLEKLGQPREVGPLPNRAMRRRMKAAA